MQGVILQNNPKNCATRDPEVLQQARHSGDPMVFCYRHICYDCEGKETEVPTEEEVMAHDPKIGLLLFPSEYLLVFTLHKLLKL